MIFSVLAPLLHRLDPEESHRIVLRLLGSPLSALLPAIRADVEPVHLWGLSFRNRLGLAAGADKNGEALAAWPRLGFGFVEVGTVTPRPQAGKAPPRVFRYPEAGAILNRMGLPNDGAAAVARRIEAARHSGALAGIPVAVSIGPNADEPPGRWPEAFAEAFRAVGGVADIVVANVSSPNTPALRALEAGAAVAPVLAALAAANGEGGPRRPILLKVSPDLDDRALGSLLEAAVRGGAAGVVATNTTVSREGLPPEASWAGTGGVSGRPLERRSTEVVRFIVRETGGRLVVVGVGGVFSLDDYRRKIDAGASLVQIYTGLVLRGPVLLREILEGVGARASAA